MIYVVCPNLNSPCGGIRVLYRHVDILNDHGIDAAILHTGRGFRCTWFENQTRVMDLSDTRIEPSDILVLPETSEKDFVARDRWTMNRHKKGSRQLAKSNARRVIFNQNTYYTFRGRRFHDPSLDMLYTQPNTLGAIVVSEDNQRYLNLAFDNLDVYRVHNTIDPDLFYYSERKKKQIAFMPRKNARELDQVINILRLRGLANDFQFVPIDGMPEEAVARVMRDSLLFLSFGYPEGFSLPPAEAMACGCIVIGYHGRGGSEYFHPQFSYPIENGHIVDFVETTEHVVQLWRDEPSRLISKARQASGYIRENYSPQNTEHDVISVWSEILSKNSSTRAAA